MSYMLMSKEKRCICNIVVREELIEVPIYYICYDQWLNIEIRKQRKTLDLHENPCGKKSREEEKVSL